jgi:hypothetical protein
VFWDSVQKGNVLVTDMLFVACESDAWSTTTTTAAATSVSAAAATATTTVFPTTTAAAGIRARLQSR